MDCLNRHKIVPERVVYIGKFKNETEKYAKEGPSLLRLFLNTMVLRLIVRYSLTMEGHFLRAELVF